MIAYPKIFAIGTDYIRDIFKDAVIVEEKIDGSQIGFGKLNGNLYIRSKGKQLFYESPEKMFQNGIDYLFTIQDRLPEGVMFYGEYLQKPKHNTLKYDRIPQNHIALFGAMKFPEQKFIDDREWLHSISINLELDIVPQLFCGVISNINELNKLLECESYLGGVHIEGIVVKNYKQPFLLGGQPIPIMCGKYVSEKFKEVHRSGWGKENTGKGKWETFVESFRTEARWEKAIQHLRDNGELKETPQDIGNLIKEVNSDIIAEEKENIKEFLWNNFYKDILRKATTGFPEWYKQKLMEKSFE